MRLPGWILAASLILVSTIPAAAATSSEEWLIPPVDAVVDEYFRSPETAWGPGHRGIDYAVPPGTRVRASGAGVVTFAGPVADITAVTVAHRGGFETTYSSLAEVYVTAGDVVTAGTWIGTVGEAHPGAGTGLHLAVKQGDGYLDPEPYLGPVDAGRAIMLAPLTWRPPPALEQLLDVPGPLSARHDLACGPMTDGAGATAPNDNLVIVVPGIGSASHAGSSRMLRDLAVQAGYPSHVVFPFSYSGTEGPKWHRAYASTDTFGPIERAADRLEELVLGLAWAYPGRDVDVIAHSQGGVVARTFLQRNVAEWRAGSPRVAHLVTLSSPHSGAPLAGAVPGLGKSGISKAVLRLAGAWARRGGPIPDPYSDATGDLAPGSPLMNELVREDLVFGVRGLSLAIPNDVVVPADRAELPGELHRSVPPAGLNGHDAILTSPEAIALTSRFLRDGRDTCAGATERWGRAVGRSISWGESALPRAFQMLRALWQLP